MTAVGARPPRALLIAAGGAVVAVWGAAAWFRLTRPAPGAIDLGWDRIAGANPSSALHAIAEAFAFEGGGVPAVLVAVAVAILIGVLRGWGWALFTVAASLLSEVDVLALKSLAMRARPDSAFGIGTAFPSGHAANAALLGVVVILVIPRAAVRIPVAAFVLAMAWSRTALHAHWLTDVLGGVAVGAGTALLLHALWSQALERRRGLRP